MHKGLHQFYKRDDNFEWESKVWIEEKSTCKVQSYHGNSSTVVAIKSLPSPLDPPMVCIHYGMGLPLDLLVSIVNHILFYHYVWWVITENILTGGNSKLTPSDILVHVTIIRLHSADVVTSHGRFVRKVGVRVLRFRSSVWCCCVNWVQNKLSHIRSVSSHLWTANISSKGKWRYSP